MGSDCSNTDLANAAENEDTEKMFLAQLRQTAAAIQAALGQYFGMSHVRVILLRNMGLDLEMNQTEIQQKLGVDRAEVTRIIKQMEKDGWITRRPDPADNRFTLVQLTEIGRARQQEINTKIRKLEACKLQGLSREDLLCTQKTLTRMRMNIERLAPGNPESETLS